MSARKRTALAATGPSLEGILRYAQLAGMTVLAEDLDYAADLGRSEDGWTPETLAEARAYLATLTRWYTEALGLARAADEQERGYEQILAVLTLATKAVGGTP